MVIDCGLSLFGYRAGGGGVMRQNSSIPAAPPDTPGCSWSGLELGLGQISDTSGSNNNVTGTSDTRHTVRKYLRAKCFDTN